MHPEEVNLGAYLIGNTPCRYRWYYGALEIQKPNGTWVESALSGVFPKPKTWQEAKAALDAAPWITKPERVATPGASFRELLARKA